MDWIENILKWRALSEHRKQQIRWDSIPDDVRQSMAFEGEPVPTEWIREMLGQIEPPTSLKPPKKS